MANNRKVQADIDRLLKRTNEGIEAYEELFDKFETAPNPNVKERLEGDLKKEIKKLQRHREQIKGFIASSEVKDTKQLEMYRKRIEEKMEAFKTCEREMKTKAFSKEGLASAANDWNDTPLGHTEAWLKGAIEECRKKIELLDYDVQRSNTSRQNRKTKQQKSDIHTRLEKLHIHQYKWEALLRMVTNEEVMYEEVDRLQPFIERVLQDGTSLPDISNMSEYDEFDIPEPKVKPIVDDETATAAAAAAAAATAAAAANAAATTATSAAAAANEDKKSPANSTAAAAAAGAASPKSAAVRPTPPSVPVQTKPSASNTAASTRSASAMNNSTGNNRPGSVDSNARGANTPSTAASSFVAVAANNNTNTNNTNNNNNSHASGANAATPSLPPAAQLRSSSSQAKSTSKASQDPSTSLAAMAAATASAGKEMHTMSGALEELEPTPAWVEDDMDALNDDTFGDAAMPTTGLGGGNNNNNNNGGGFSLAEMASHTSKLASEWERQSPASLAAAGHGARARNETNASETAASKAGTPMEEWDAASQGHRQSAAKPEPRRPKPESTSAAAASSPTTTTNTNTNTGAAELLATAAAGSGSPAPAHPTPSANTATIHASPPAAAMTMTTSKPASPGSAAHLSEPRDGRANASGTALAAVVGGSHGQKYDMVTTLNLLDMSLANLPHTLDVERQRPYEPPNATEPIPYFPQEVHQVFANREIYKNFDLDTLFFIFYYHQKSYQQYFAAKELKAHSFRFHTELRRWYLRREKPRETSRTGERGSYTYFDYEDTWDKQTVDDFTFEYEYLEDDLK